MLDMPRMWHVALSRHRHRRTRTQEQDSVYEPLPRGAVTLQHARSCLEHRGCSAIEGFDRFRRADVVALPALAPGKQSCPSGAVQRLRQATTPVKAPRSVKGLLHRLPAVWKPFHKNQMLACNKSLACCALSPPRKPCGSRRPCGKRDPRLSSGSPNCQQVPRGVAGRVESACAARRDRVRRLRLERIW